MATRKTRGGAAAHKRQARGPAKAADVLRERWDKALAALTAAEAEVEKQVRALLRKNKVGTREARETLQKVRARFEKERRKAQREWSARLSEAQARLHKERRALGHFVDEAVRGTLVALNIPSRREVADLTRKVEQLSRKIDGFSARPRRRPARRVSAPPAAHAAHAVHASAAPVGAL